MLDNKNGSVYFILDTSCNLVKIGYSKDVHRRMKQFKTSNCNLKLLYQIDNCSMDYEKMLHEFFKHIRVKREWFRYDSCIKLWIKRHKLEQQYRN